MRRRWPVGVSDFKELVEDGYYFADKSLLIKDIVDSGAKSILLLRPRRFGKTLNLSMLRYFYEKTEMDHSRLFRPLQIWKQGDAYRIKQGQYPVIYLTFKDVKALDWEACQDHMKRVIADEYARHREMLGEPSMTETERETFRGIIQLQEASAAYEQSLKKLSALLTARYGRKTVILIDEYDTPILEGYLNGYYKEAVSFMRNLLSGGLKDNVHLEKGILTGILRVAKESVFSGLNHLDAPSLWDEEFSRYFGLTQEETEALLQEDEATAPSHSMDEVKRWYNGYRFGTTTIYNPWSIVNYAAKANHAFRPYWVNTSNNDLIRMLVTKSGPEVKADLETLLAGGGIRAMLNDHVVFESMDRSPSVLWSFLLFSGYLKLADVHYKDGEPIGTLALPNLEVETLYLQIITDWFHQSIYPAKHRMMLQALLDDDKETFEHIFCEFVRESFSYFDSSGAEPEKVYHAFVLGLSVGMRETHTVKSNRESGYGRYDVMLVPRSLQDPGFVMEFKKVQPSKETLQQAAAAALRQIDERAYDEDLRSLGVRVIRRMGIAFEGKQVCIAWSDYTR